MKHVYNKIFDYRVMNIMDCRKIEKKMAYVKKINVNDE
jgi:hypothetical protein